MAVRPAVTMLSERAQRTYRSVHGLVSYAAETWRAWEHIRRNMALAQVLNNTAPAFFGTTHVGLYQTSILLVRHLGEAARDRGKERRLNSSFRGLFAVSFGDGETTWPQELRDPLDRFLRVSKPARSFVNKLIAHTDLAVGIGEEPTPAVNELQVDHSVRLAEELLNVYEARIGLAASDFSASTLVANLGALGRALGLHA